MADSCEACSKCPCKNPEVMKELLTKHEEAVKQIQAKLFFHQPVQFGIIFVLVNLMFFLVYKLDLSFFAVATLFALIYTLFEIVMSFLAGPLTSFFNPAIADMGAPDASNRIRSASEVAAIASAVIGKIRSVCPFCEKSEGLPVKKIVALAILFVVFLLTGTFWLNFAIVNLVLILPGVLLHPAVYEHVGPILEKVFPSKKND